MQPNLWHMSSAINKFMSWVMKGYIAQMKGFNVNWAKVATSISKEKACRVVYEKVKSGRSSDVSKLSGGEIFCKMEHDNIVCKSCILQGGNKGKNACPYGVPIGEIIQVQDLQLFSNDMFRHLKLKDVHLQGEATQLFEKLVGLRYNTNDHKAIITKAQGGFDHVKCKMKVVTN